MMKKIIFTILSFYFWVILKTSKATIIGRDVVEKDFFGDFPIVCCCPHHFLLMLFAGIEIGKLKRPEMTLLISLSQDGEYIANLLKRYRFSMVRGSSNRGARNALLKLRRIGEMGQSIGIAYDGPKGPPLVPKKGLIGCLRSTKGPVYLIHGDAKPRNLIPFLKPFRVGSWDKFFVPVPFSNITVNFEKVPTCPNQLKENFKSEEDWVMHYIEMRGKELYGYLYQGISNKIL